MGGSVSVIKSSLQRAAVVQHIPEGFVTDTSSANNAQSEANEVIWTPSSSQHHEELLQAPVTAPVVIQLDPSVCITPRRAMNMLQCVPCTPRGNEVNQFPYYCPLCMEYFSDTLRTNCCGNYVCFPCASAYIQSQGLEVSVILMWWSSALLHGFVHSPILLLFTLLKLV